MSQTRTRTAQTPAWAAWASTIYPSGGTTSGSTTALGLRPPSAPAVPAAPEVPYRMRSVALVAGSPSGTMPVEGRVARGTYEARADCAARGADGTRTASHVRTSRAERTRDDRRSRTSGRPGSRVEGAEGRSRSRGESTRARTKGPAMSGRARSGASSKDKGFSLPNPMPFIEAHRLPVAVVAVLVVLVLMLYGPAHDYYHAWRRSLELQTTYDAIVADSEDVRDDVSRLQSREGIEDEARKRGYVEEGETAVVVEGLPEEDSGEVDTTYQVPWYLQVTDLVFGYTPEGGQ